MKPECLSFATRYEPGVEDAHRSECPECARYARAVELAAQASRSLPLPRGLADRLRDLAPREEPGPQERDPAGRRLRRAPELPLPAHLAARLRAIPRQHRATPPSWVLRPAASLAASLLLTVVLTWLIGDPVRRIEPWARTVTLRAGLVLEDQTVRGKIFVRRLVGSALDSVERETGTPPPTSFPAPLWRWLEDASAPPAKAQGTSL